jgi:hypothetical protein
VVRARPKVRNLPLPYNEHSLLHWVTVVQWPNSSPDPMQRHQIVPDAQAFWQLDEQRSKFLWLPSSQASPASCTPLPQTVGGGQVVMAPLQFNVVAVTLHGCEQVNTGPPGQSSSHPVVMAWLVWSSFSFSFSLWPSFAFRTSPQPVIVTNNVATSA